MSTDEAAEYQDWEASAVAAEWPVSQLNQCVDACLVNRYGESYEWAKKLSPISITDYIAGEFTEGVATKLSKTANTNAWSANRKEHLAGLRQIQTLKQFRTFTGGMSVIGVGAAGFQAGANAYCAVDCLK